MLAEARFLSFDQRAALIDDESRRVRLLLWDGPDHGAWGWRDRPAPMMTDEQYERLARRDPKAAGLIVSDSRWLTGEQKRRFLAVAGTTLEPPVAPAAEDPADIVAWLPTDPSPEVRLEASMRRELTEAQRAAIDYEVGPQTRVRPPRWVYETRDPSEQRRCATSAHLGLRRGITYNQHLDPELIPLLAADDDVVVRLLLCEAQENVPVDLIIDSYVEADVLNAGRLLNHPALDWSGQATRLAGHPRPKARALAVRDLSAPAELIERLSHDEHPAVRRSVADDERLSPSRALELFEDPHTTERAAAGPHLPVARLERILAEAATLPSQDAADPREQAVHLG